MSKVITTTFQLRRGNSSWYKTNNPVLAQGEPAYELDTKKLKIGDGVHNYSAIPYLADKTQAIIAPLFDEDEFYSVGDYVIKDDTLYQFIHDHQAEPWDEEDVVEDEIWAALNRLESTINAKYTKPVNGIPTNDIANGAITNEKLTTEILNLIYNSYPSETQTNASIVETTLAANNLPLSALEVWICAAQAGSGDPTPSNVRPLTARTETNVIVSPTASAIDGTTYPISLSSIPGGVWLGKLNVLTGELTVVAEALTIDGVNRKVTYQSTFQTSAPSGGKIFCYTTPTTYTHNIPANVRPYMTGDRVKLGWSWTMPLYSYGYNRGSDQDHQ